MKIKKKKREIRIKSNLCYLYIHWIMVKLSVTYPLHRAYLFPSCTPREATNCGELTSASLALFFRFLFDGFLFKLLLWGWGQSWGMSFHRSLLYPSFSIGLICVHGLTTAGPYSWSVVSPKNMWKHIVGLTIKSFQ